MNEQNRDLRFLHCRDRSDVLRVSIYLLLAKQYAEAKEVAVTAVFGLIMGTVTASGIPEAVAAAILVFALGKVLLKVYNTNK